MAAPRKEDVKEMILNATELLLNSHSLSDISLASIAENAGISKGTLYYHYKNKTEILFDITNRYLDRQWDDLIAWTENKEKDTSVPRLVRYVLERNTSSASMRIHLLNAAMCGDEVMRERLVARYRQFEHLIAEKIAERTDKVSADFLTWLILLASDGVNVQTVLRNENFNSGEFLKQSTDYLKFLG